MTGCFSPLAGEENQGIYDLIPTLKKTRAHGDCFYYADANPIVAQWMLERISGTDVIDHMSTFWQRIGAEDMATLKLDQVATAVGTIGLAMTARDYARLGLMMHNQGRVETGYVFPGIDNLVDGMKRDPGPERWTNETTFLGQTAPGMGYSRLPVVRQALARVGPIVAPHAFMVRMTVVLRRVAMAGEYPTIGLVLAVARTCCRKRSVQGSSDSPA